MKKPSIDVLIRSEFTGAMISTASEEWRHELEIAYLLSLTSAQQDLVLDGDPSAADNNERSIMAVRGPAEVAFLRREIERLGKIRADNRK